MEGTGMTAGALERSGGTPERWRTLRRSRRAFRKQRSKVCRVEAAKNTVDILRKPIKGQERNGKLL